MRTERNNVLTSPMDADDEKRNYRSFNRVENEMLKESNEILKELWI